jgi:hypothetical protein
MLDKPHAQLRSLLAATTALLGLLLVSCASPGPPRPPSLHLPEVVTDLAVRRVGDVVHLSWTTPSRTTDGLAVSPPLTAEICREVPAPAGSNSECKIVARVPVQPGASRLEDRLPGDLALDPVVALRFRIRILNSQDRAAGYSREALAAAGAAPPMVEGLKITGTRTGVLVEWQPVQGDWTIELKRELAGGAAIASRPQKSEVLAAPKEQAEVVLEPRTNQEGAGQDAGGMLDRTAVRGRTYIYRAQRIRKVAVAGETLELRSELSAPVSIVLKDSFPPERPAALAAVPGVDGTGIDLSWRANSESDLAGYNVYRDDGQGGSFRRLASLVPSPAYSDTDVVPGRVYTYRVTAVDSAGNESAPSETVTETGPARRKEQ